MKGYVILIKFSYTVYIIVSFKTNEIMQESLIFICISFICRIPETKKKQLRFFIDFVVFTWGGNCILINSD